MILEHAVLRIRTGSAHEFEAALREALPLIEQILGEKSLRLEGVMTHFSQSDEVDKTFAHLQFSRFNEVLTALAQVATVVIAIRSVK